MTRYDIAVFDGDGIGPEVMAPALKLLEVEARRSGRFGFNFKHLPAGAGHFKKTGEALPEDSVAQAAASDAILLSAMGLPGVFHEDGREITPQIDIRIRLGLFAGIRPVFLLPGHASPLKDVGPGDLDFVLVRESTEGLFHSMGRGQRFGDEAAEETLRITRATCEKLFRFAFDLARRRKASGQGPGRVHCIDKANVFEAFAFFRDIFFEIAKEFPDIQAEAAYVDAAAMWMVTRPEMFDVMVTENMFGDILSDLGAGLMGSLGLAPSADIGQTHGVFQPCHGTAPDIAGQGIANPLAMILSAAMMCDWLGGQKGDTELAALGPALRGAVEHVLSAGATVTPDLGGTGTTGEVAAAVERALVL